MSLEDITQGLAAAGLELVSSFSVDAYNQARGAGFELSGGSVAICVGNGRGFWGPFRAWLDVRDLPPDPVDRYIEDSIGRVVADAAGVANVVYAHRVYDGAYAAMITAAELAGIAHRSPAHLAIHPQYGLWIALRALIVMSDPGPTLPAQEPPASPCDGCVGKPCLPALSRAQRETATLASWRSAWPHWLALRDACPVGRQARYSEAQVRYHYTNDPQVLYEPCVSGCTT